MYDKAMFQFLTTHYIEANGKQIINDFCKHIEEQNLKPSDVITRLKDVEGYFYFQKNIETFLSKYLTIIVIT